MIIQAGQENSIMVSVSVCQVGKHAIDLSHQCRWLNKGHAMCYVCDDAYKRSLAICKSRALCPISRLLHVPI